MVIWVQDGCKYISCLSLLLLLLLSVSVVSDSVRPHRQQPTRLRCPWDSPGKNTGVGCHFLLQCMKVKSESEFAQSCPTLCDLMDCSPPGSSVHGIFQARVLEWVAIAFSESRSSLGIPAPCYCLATSKSILVNARMGKNQNSKSDVWFLLNVFHTIVKWKNHKPNHCK